MRVWVGERVGGRGYGREGENGDRLRVSSNVNDARGLWWWWRG